MNNFIAPKIMGEFGLLDGEWAEDSSVSLGGSFYDHLRSPVGDVIGVRYWIIDDVDFASHPVYSLFIKDDRFLFNKKEKYIDIVFDSKNSDYLKNGEISVDNSQDFGGDMILKNGSVFGLSFSLNI